MTYMFSDQQCVDLGNSTSHILEMVVVNFRRSTIQYRLVLRITKSNILCPEVTIITSLAKNEAKNGVVV